MFRTSFRRSHEDHRVEEFVRAIRRSAAPATIPLQRVSTDTVAIPRIVLRSATPPGGWSVYARESARAATAWVAPAILLATVSLVLA